MCVLYIYIFLYITVQALFQKLWEIKGNMKISLIPPQNTGQSSESNRNVYKDYTVQSQIRQIEIRAGLGVYFALVSQKVILLIGHTYKVVQEPLRSVPLKHSVLYV